MVRRGRAESPASLNSFARKGGGAVDEITGQLAILLRICQVSLESEREREKGARRREKKGRRLDHHSGPGRSRRTRKEIISLFLVPFLLLFLQILHHLLLRSPPRSLRISPSAQLSVGQLDALFRNPTRSKFAPDL